MKDSLVRTALIAASGVLAAALISGCTLTGAAPAPLTPVGENAGLPTGEPTTETLPPTPTKAATIDVFGTQTAQALTQGPTTPTPTTEPGGPILLTPTPGLGVITPTPIVSGTPGTPKPPVTPGTSGGSGQCPATYTVQAGDNLFRIALKFGLTTNQLAAANGITNPAAIYVGQVLKIPGCGGSNQGNTTPQTGGSTYTVQSGDNLFRIALKFGLDWHTLAAFNNISDPTTLYVGQVLNIPPH